MWAKKKMAHIVFLFVCGSILSAVPLYGVSSENTFDRIQAGEWVIASIPVAAVAAGGKPTVRIGSRIVATGSNDGWPM